MAPESPEQRYARYLRALGTRPLPLALVDLDAFEANLRTLVGRAARAGKPLRLATKSVRSVELLRRALAQGAPHCQGLMVYTAAEARHLAEHGFDDLLLAYPTAQLADAEILAALNQTHRISVVVDDRAQLGPLAQASRGRPLPVVIELDLSLRPVGETLHLGVRRSPLHTPEQVVELAEAIRAQPALRLIGVMAYEAQIAGLGDQRPVFRAVKRASEPVVRERRRAVRQALTARGFALELFNGGGTGSLDYSGADPALTELSAGSGLLDGHLFDHYEGLSLEPAACFGIQVCRRPGPGLVTCHGGGLMASGAAGPDRAPTPYLPAGLALLSAEGAGEVQTPLTVPAGLVLPLGAPVFFRHAKSGELAEHFLEYQLIRGDQTEGTARTYRGDGKAFL